MGQKLDPEWRAGPIMEPRDGVIRHCDDPKLENKNCPYLAWGCSGCMFSSQNWLRRRRAEKKAIVTEDEVY